MELIEEGENGYVVNLNDISDIQEKISKVVDDNQTILSMRNRCIAKVKDYTIEKMALAHKRIIIDSFKSCSSNA